MKKLLFISLLLMGIHFPSVARYYETIHLKNGLSYRGFIKEQIIGDSIFFHSMFDEEYIPANLIEKKEKVNRNDFSPEWKQWLEHNEFEKLVLFRITPKKNASFAPRDQVQILSLRDGQYLIRYIADRVNDFPLKDIKAIEYSKPDDLDCNYLKDEIVLKDKSVVTGNIVRMEVGKHYDVLTRDGIIQEVKISDVKLLKKIKANKLLPIDKQSPYLDIVECNAEDEIDKGSETKGIITEKGPGYIKLHSGEKFENKKIKKLKREDNKDYIVDLSFAPFKDEILVWKDNRQDNISVENVVNIYNNSIPYNKDSKKNSFMINKKQLSLELKGSEIENTLKIDLNNKVLEDNVFLVEMNNSNDGNKDPDTYVIPISSHLPSIVTGKRVLMENSMRIEYKVNPSKKYLLVYKQNKNDYKLYMISVK